MAGSIAVGDQPLFVVANNNGWTKYPTLKKRIWLLPVAKGIYDISNGLNRRTLYLANFSTYIIHNGRALAKNTLSY